jgi:ketosteroid isomerase-like protein
MTKNPAEMIKRIYHSFNARDIDAVLAVLSDDVAWANGMDGGFIYGREAVRDYWTRQWAVVSPYVDPVAFETTDDGTVAVEAVQSVVSLDGQPLDGQTHGLLDKTVRHIFRMEANKIIRFEIQDSM